MRVKRCAIITLSSYKCLIEIVGLYFPYEEYEVKEKIEKILC